MRIPFALLIFGGLVAGTIVTQASEADTSCAATFSMLSASARSHSLPTQDFDRMAGIAMRHGGTITPASQMQASDLSLPELQAQVVNCHARYEGKGGDMRVASN
jgi:hypothetical protein